VELCPILCNLIPRAFSDLKVIKDQCLCQPMGVMSVFVYTLLNKDQWPGQWLCSTNKPDEPFDVKVRCKIGRWQY